MKDDSRNTPVVDLATEKDSQVRLILQKPGSGQEVLLRRYKADESDEQYFRFGGDNKSDLLHTCSAVQSYWTFKGLPHFNLIKGDTSLRDAVRRVAYRQLGIEIGELNTVHVTYSGALKGVLKCIYMYTYDWEGDLKTECNPESAVFMADSYLQGTHVWCRADQLSAYLHHPEAIAAAKAAQAFVLRQEKYDVKNEQP